MAYSSATKKPKAASKPSQRDMPFSMKDTFHSAAGVKGDPVGTQKAVDPYEIDKRLNWVDRS